jgi:hypothetical protein
MKEVTFEIDDNLYRYLDFLEKSRFTRSKKEALHTALEFYRVLSMHDWLPFTYRMGGGRVLLMDTTMILDFFHLLNNREIFDAAKISALKRKVTNPFFKDVNFSSPENWPLVLREMEIMGWGKFKQHEDSIEVDSCILPAPYLRGYFEGMFGVPFQLRPTKADNIMKFSKKKTAK